VNNLPSKKVLSIFILTLALVTSIIIAFGRDKGSTAINFASNLVAGEKVSVPENPNWQNELGDVSANTKLGELAEDDTEKTVTDNVSISLISNYLAMKRSGTLTQESADKLFSQTLDYINKTGEKTIEIPKLNIIPDNGRQSIADYGENLGNILRNNKPKDSRNEMEIFQQILATKDPKKIDELQEAVYVYNKVLNDITKIPVPKTFVKAHTDIMIGMSAIILGLQEVKFVLNDPVRGLQGIQTYQQGGSLFIESIGATLEFIKQNKIIYKQGSGGYYLLYGI